jgi:hypothetical protein
MPITSVEAVREKRMSESDEKKKTKAWYVRHDGVPAGPFPGAKIRHLLLSGEFTMADQISVDRKRWLKMLEVPEVVPLPLRAEAGDFEAQAELQRRAQSEATSAAEERRIPWMAIGVMLFLIGSIVGTAIWVGIPDAVDTPQCDAVPAPGVNWRNCQLPGIDVGSASLAGANLNTTVLRESRLSATNLSGADLRYADLSGADLRYTDLRQSLLLGSNLQLADLRGSNLSGADLRFADLRGSLLENANFEGANLRGAIWVDGVACEEPSIGRCLTSSP